MTSDNPFQKLVNFSVFKRFFLYSTTTSDIFNSQKLKNLVKVLCFRGDSEIRNCPLSFPSVTVNS